MLKHIALFLAFIAVGLLFSACNPQQIQPTATATLAPTRTSKPSSTPRPTSTATEPTNTKARTETMTPFIAASQTAVIAAFQCQNPNDNSRIPSNLLVATPRAEESQRLIAFNSDPHADLYHGYIDIYTIRLDGSNLKRLTNNRTNNRGPSWSNDGKKILFSSDRNRKNCNENLCDYERFIINLDGTGSRRFTRDLPEYPKDDISPDGKYRAYDREFYDEQRLRHLMMDFLSDIIVEPIGGSQEKNITSHLQPGYFSNVRWSPTGKQFVFTGITYQFVESWWEDIYMSNADGSGLQKLPGGPFWSSVSTAVWSPTGDRLAFLTKKGIAMMNADGSGFSEYVLDTKLGRRELYWPSGGEQLLFMDSDEQYYNINADFTGLEKLPFSNSLDKLLYRFELLQTDTLSYQFTYTYLSPDKNWIAYYACDQLRIISTKTHQSFLVHNKLEAAKVIKGSTLAVYPGRIGSGILWSPDSTQLIFTQEFRYDIIVHNFHGLFAVHLDGTNLRKIADDVWAPAIQP